MNIIDKALENNIFHLLERTYLEKAIINLLHFKVN